MKQNDRRSRRFIFILGCVFAVGSCLRLYMLSSQILLDDEWLGLNAVIGKSYFEIITKFNPLDNTSLPLNIYSLALFHSFGWSELTVRLPAILAGLCWSKMCSTNVWRLYLPAFWPSHRFLFFTAALPGPIVLSRCAAFPRCFCPTNG